MIRIVLQTLGERRIYTKSTPNLAKFITEDLNRLCTSSNWDLMNKFEWSLIFCSLYSSYHKDIFVDMASRWYLLRWHCNKRPQLGKYNSKIYITEHQQLKNHTIDNNYTQCWTYRADYLYRLTLETSHNYHPGGNKWRTVPQIDNLPTYQLRTESCQQVTTEPFKRLFQDINSKDHC